MTMIAAQFFVPRSVKRYTLRLFRNLPRIQRYFIVIDRNESIIGSLIIETAALQHYAEGICSFLLPQ